MSPTPLTLALDGGFLATVGRGAGAIVIYAVLGTLLMLIGFWATDLTTPGKLTQLVRDGRPGAVVVTAGGVLGMAFIVVTAIFGASGSLAEGLPATLIYGLVGIIVQVGAVRLLEWVTGIRIGEVLAAEAARPEAWVVAIAHIALGLVVAVAIL